MPILWCLLWFLWTITIHPATSFVLPRSSSSSSRRAVFALGCPTTQTSFLRLTADQWEDEIDKQCTNKYDDEFDGRSLYVSFLGLPFVLFEKTTNFAIPVQTFAVVVVILRIFGIRLPSGRRRGVMASLGISQEMLQSVRENKRALVQNDLATTALEEALEAQKMVKTNLERNIAELQVGWQNRDEASSTGVEVSFLQGGLVVVQAEVSEIKEQLVATKRRRRSLVDQQVEFEATRTRKLAAEQTREAAKLVDGLDLDQTTGSLLAREFRGIEKKE